MDDASLDDFLDVDDGDDRARTEADGGDAATEPPVDSSAVDPVAVTAKWSPADGTCASCGETVERLWTDEDESVCADCKRW
jgi:hypothetical protein